MKTGFWNTSFRGLITSTAFLLAVAWSGTAMRANATDPSGNDNFANAWEITGAVGTLSESNEGATAESGETYYYSTATIWFRWTAPTNGVMAINTEGSGFDTILGVYAGTDVRYLSEVVFNDDAYNQESRVSFFAEAGMTYFIVVGGYSDTTGRVVLNWEFYTGPFEMKVQNGVVTGYRGRCPLSVTAGDWPANVTEIAEGAFCFAEMESVAIPATVMTIDESAFLSCHTLTNVTFLGNKDAISMEVESVFKDTPWLKIQPFTLLTYEDEDEDEIYLYGYYGQAPAELVIPSGVTVIQGSAFLESPFESVVIPASVYSIEDAAFARSSSLTNVTFLGNRDAIDMLVQESFSDTPWLDRQPFTFITYEDGGDVYLTGYYGSPIPETLSIPADVTEIVAGAIPTLEWKRENDRYYEFDAWYTAAHGGEEFDVDDDFSVTSRLTLYARWERADVEWDYVYDDDNEDMVILSGCSVPLIGDVVLPASIVEDDGDEVTTYAVSRISESAFSENTMLTSVTIPASVTAIEDWTFQNCTHLTNVVFAGGMNSIEMDPYLAFWGTPWADTLPKPANDEFDNAQALANTSTGSVQGTLFGATLAENDCILEHAGVEKTVWYSWTSPLTGKVRFVATEPEDRNDELRLIATRGYVEILDRWIDPVYDGENSLILPVTEGETYYVSLGSYDYEISGFTLSWETYVLAPNDDFTNAITIVGTSGSVTGMSVGASVESGEPLSTSTFESEATLWWKWTAPSSGKFSFSTEGSNFDTVLGIYTGSAVDNLTLVELNDDYEFDSTSLVEFSAQAGVTYYIVVGGYQDECGNISLQWGSVPDDDEGIEVLAGDNDVSQNADGSYCVTSVNGDDLTEDDVDDVEVWTTLDDERVEVTDGYDIVLENGEITVRLRKPEIETDVDDELRDATDKSGFLVSPGKVTVSAVPSVSLNAPGVTLGALPVRTVPGLYYRASWGASLQDMTYGEKVQATDDVLYLGVIKQTGSSGFYGVTVSEQ